MAFSAYNLPTGGSALNEHWSAHWIWYPGKREAVNWHFLARKAFRLDRPVGRAVLRITAHSDYVLFINGTRLGAGPVPCDPRRQSYDSYDVARLLRAGVNVIGVIGHNYGLGVHWQYKGPGGLLAQLDLDDQTIATDGSWRVSDATGWRAASPRMFFSNGLLETLDLRTRPEGWLGGDFDDAGWLPAEVIGPHPVKPWTALVPREIPPLEEAPLTFTPLARGRFNLRGVHVIRFDGIISPGKNGLAYAQSRVYSAEECPARLVFECDDACKVFLNGRLAHEVNYSEAFARTRVWRAGDEYEQVHYGMHERYDAAGAPVTLRAGWNTLLAVVDQGPGGWGFLLAFTNADGTPLDLPHERWQLAGPCPSSGLSDSLDAVARDIRRVDAPARIDTDSRDYTRVTDYAMLMRYEQRTDVQPVDGPVTLHAGEVLLAIADRVWVFHPELTVRARDEAILDIGYSQVLLDDHGIRFSNGGVMKYVDRVYLRDGEQTVRTLQRRTGRYLHLSCRRGTVEIVCLGAQTLGYPIREQAEFACSDPVLNRVWDVSRHTTRLLMQYGYQDCLKREEGAQNPSSFNYLSRAAGLWCGDYLLARKALRQALDTQDETGWFHAHGISSPSSDEPTQCLWWMVWLRDYYWQSGDLDFVREAWDGLEDALRYFGKSINRRGLIDGRNHHVFRQGQYVYMDDSTNRGPYVGYFGGELLGYNILYFAGLRAAAELAEALGLAERAEFHRRKAARVRQACSERFWDERWGRFIDWRKGNRRAETGHTAFQIAALYFGLADEAQQHRLFDYLRDEVGVPDEERVDYPLHTFGFFYYLLEVWFRHSNDAHAVELLRRYFGRWVELGGTAFGEAFSLAEAKGLTMLPWEYEVHGYGASAHLHFYTNILGIRPLTPGFRRVLLRPRPGGLAWAEGRVITPAGPVQVRWEAREAEFVLTAGVPAACEYELDLPPGFQRYAITVNGAAL